MDLDPVEIRVLGCLVEKQRTTPDAYPLSLNALRLACNQSTNRDPVVQYDEEMIRGALHRLGRRGWTRLAGAGRAAKYRHLLDEKPGLSADEQALLAVLALRGPQTPGELRARTERLHRFADFAALRADALRGSSTASSRCGSSAAPGRRRSATRTCSATTSRTRRRPRRRSRGAQARRQRPRAIAWARSNAASRRSSGRSRSCVRPRAAARRARRRPWRAP